MRKNFMNDSHDVSNEPQTGSKNGKTIYTNK